MNDCWLYVRLITCIYVLASGIIRFRTFLETNVTYLTWAYVLLDVVEKLCFTGTWSQSSPHPPSTSRYKLIFQVYKSVSNYRQPPLRPESSSTLQLDEMLSFFSLKFRLDFHFTTTARLFVFWIMSFHACTTEWKPKIHNVIIISRRGAPYNHHHHNRLSFSCMHGFLADYRLCLQRKWNHVTL